MHATECLAAFQVKACDQSGHEPRESIWQVWCPCHSALVTHSRFHKAKPKLKQPLCCFSSLASENPCKFSMCRYPRPVCKAVGKKATCQCRKKCPRHYDPVCASNGETYNNMCLLELTACLLEDTGMPAGKLTYLANGNCTGRKCGGSRTYLKNWFSQRTVYLRFKTVQSNLEDNQTHTAIKKTSQIKRSKRTIHSKPLK